MVHSQVHSARTTPRATIPQKKALEAKSEDRDSADDSALAISEVTSHCDQRRKGEALLATPPRIENEENREEKQTDGRKYTGELHYRGWQEKDAGGDDENRVKEKEEEEDEHEETGAEDDLLSRSSSSEGGDAVADGRGAIVVVLAERDDLLRCVIQYFWFGCRHRSSDLGYTLL